MPHTRRPGCPRRVRFLTLLLVVCTVAVACSSSEPEASASEPSTSAPSSSAPSTDATTTSDTSRATGADDSPPALEPSPLEGAYVPRVIATFPHDPTAYTQGLELLDQHLIESTGLRGSSDRRLVDIETGEALTTVSLTDDLFAEGITVVDDELIQITWQSGVYIRSDANSLTETQRGSYDGEGWGLCFDGDRLVMSNGTSQLTFRDPDTFQAEGSVTVSRSDGTEVPLLNELECVNGQVFANIYTSDEIVVIDPTSGSVAASIDAGSLRPDGVPADDADFALNGIAFDETSQHFFVTGKWWPVLYEVEFVSG